MNGVLSLPSGTNIVAILKNYPEAENDDLAAVMRVNLKIKGKVSVTTQDYTFASGKKKSRVFYITPFENFDFFVNIKRALVGVEFPSNIKDANRITKYALGQLVQGTNEYKLAEAETKKAIEEKRRIHIAVAPNDIAITIEESQEGCIIL